MKTKILFLPVVAMMFLAVSCAKTKVITKKTIDITVANTDWVAFGTTGTNEHQYRASVAVPEITQNVMDNGMVLVYLNTSSANAPSDPTGGYALMPYVVTYTGYTRVYGAVYYLGSVTFTEKDTDTTTPGTYDMQFRVVVCDEVEKSLLVNTDLNNYDEVVQTLEASK